MKKSKTLLSLAVGALAFASAGAMFSIHSVSATEFTPQVSMLAGASVRIVSVENEASGEKNGLRFTTYMNADEYETLMANDAYSNVKFGVLIAPDTAAYTLTEESVFGAGADKKYDWATWNETEQKWEYTASSYTRIMNFETSVLYNPNENEAEDNMYFRASIIDLDVSNIATEFQGIGYISYTKDGTTVYDFAEKEVRSMAYVAQKAIADTSADALPAEQKAWLQANYVDKVANVEASYKVEYYAEQQDGSFKVVKEETLTSTIDAEVEIPQISMEYFIFDSAQPNVLTGKVLADDSLVLKRYYVDADIASSRVVFDGAWGYQNQTITNTSDLEGLNGSVSRRSVKLVDGDMTGYDSYLVVIPAGYTGYAIDVKLVVDTQTTLMNDRVTVTNSSGASVGILKVGEWVTLYGTGSDWRIVANYKDLTWGTAPVGSATLYFDNARYFTDAEVDSDATQITYLTAWGGSTARQLIGTNSNTVGLNGENSARSILFYDRDTSGYNDLQLSIPAGYAAVSMDVKVVLNTTESLNANAKVSMQAVGVGVTTETLEVNAWKNVLIADKNASNLLYISFTFNGAFADGSASGTAEVYFDNIKYYETVDGDVGRVTYLSAWGGGPTHQLVGPSADPEGLSVSSSVRCIKIEDFDMTGYNDFLLTVGEGASVTFDVKIIVNVTSGTMKADGKVALQAYATAAEQYSLTVGEWNSVTVNTKTAANQNYLTFTFNGLFEGAYSGSAIIYIDNIR